MCGRFTLRTPANLLVEQFLREVNHGFTPRFNVCPSQPVPIARAVPDSTVPQIVPMRWGLVPAWAKDIRMGNRLINARAETVSEKPSFRSAWKKRRCLVPCDGFYEWQPVAGGKQAYFIHRADEGAFAFAGLWEAWHPPQEAEGTLLSFTIITTEANATMQPLHHRMPVILDPADYDAWLFTPANEADRLHTLTRPCPDDWLVAYRVSTYVNRPAHDSEACVQPI